jgi:hypothetical protein
MLSDLFLMHANHHPVRSLSQLTPDSSTFIHVRISHRADQRSRVLRGAWLQSPSRSAACNPTGYNAPVIRRFTHKGLKRKITIEEEKP